MINKLIFEYLIDKYEEKYDALEQRIYEIDKLIEQDAPNFTELMREREELADTLYCLESVDPTNFGIVLEILLDIEPEEE